MTAWIYNQANLIIDRDHPAKTVAKVAATVIGLLPFVMAFVLATR